MIFSVSTLTLGRCRAGVVVVGLQEPFAPRRVGGGERVPQGGIGHLAGQEALRQLLEAPQFRAVADEHAAQQRLAHPVVARPRDPLGPRQHPEGQALGARGGAVPVGEDPGRRALEEDDLARRLLHDREELDGRGTRADDGHPAPGQVVVMVPLRRMEGRPGERRGARDLGNERFGEQPAAVDQEVRRQRAPRRLEVPDPAVGVPPGLLECGVEGDLLLDPELAGRPLQVALDLGLGGEGLGPIRVGGEREGVQVRGHVAPAAGVGVVMPRPADT